MWTTEVAETARGAIPYVSHGDGDPVVCWHGFPDVPQTFGLVAERLAAKGWKVIAPYLRGMHPDHPAPAPYFDAGTRTADGKALLDALSPDAPLPLVGHDWGASLVHGLGAAYPERVTRAVTMAVPPVAALGAHLFTPEQLRRSFYIWFFQMPAFPEMILNTSNGGQLLEFIWQTWSPGAADAAHLPLVREALSHPSVVEAAVNSYRALFQDRYHDPELAELRTLVLGPPQVPVLLLGGDEDGALGVQALRDGEAHLPGGAVEIVPGTGHFLHLEQPDLVAERIDSWLRA